MTEEQFRKIPFRFASHWNMADKGIIVYIADIPDGRISVQITTFKKDGQPTKRQRKDYRFDDKWYDNFDEFLEAIKDYYPIIPKKA